MATKENSTGYKVICFIVIWLDTIVRNYLRIKAMCDAVVQVARSSSSSPYQPNISTLRSRQQQQQQRLRLRRQRPSPCYINQLPTELLQVILEMNGTSTDWFHCTMVCQRWHQLVTPLLWKVPILPSLPFHQRMIPRFARTLRKYGNTIESLRLGQTWITDDTTRSIMQYCPNVKTLELAMGGQGLTMLGYQYLARAQCTPHLTRLVMTDDDDLTDETLVALAIRCRSLQHLELVNCRRITRMGISALVAATRPCTVIIKDCVRVSGQLIKDIAQLCGPRLVRLDVSRIGTILHSDLCLLVTTCPRLKELGLGCHRSPLIRRLSYQVRMEEERRMPTIPIQQQQQQQQRTLARSKSSMPFYSKPSSTTTTTTALLMDRLQHYSNTVQDITTTTALSLDHCPEGDQVSPATVEMILNQLTRLESLELTHWSCLTDPLLQRLRQLKGSHQV